MIKSSTIACISTIISLAGPLRADAQDKPIRVRNFYYVYGGYQLRYQKTGTKPSNPQNTNKQVGPEGLKFSIKQQGDTLWYTPLPFSFDGACNPTEDVVNAYHAAKGKFYEVIGEFTDPGLRQQFDTNPCQFYGGSGAAGGTQTTKTVNGQPVKEDATRAGQQETTTSKGQSQTTIYPPGTYIRKPSRSVDIGIITIPFRLHFAANGRPIRPSVDIGAGAYLGYNMGYTNFYKGGSSKVVSLMPIYYLGIATAKLNAGNTGNRVTEDFDAAGITTGVGFLYGRQDLSIGAVIGRDFYLTPPAREWDYAKSPYVGLVLSLELAALK
jgi:hypothetical protein